MSISLRAYRFVNILSLDVAAGAVISSLFFAKLFNVTLRLQGMLALGLTVWIIYTADHLLDAKSIATTASTERHRFHQKNFTWLAILLLASVILDLFCALAIRKVIFKWGLVLTLIVVIYFLLQRKLKFMKEFFGGLIYTGGVLLPALSLYTEDINLHQCIIILQFFLTALINLILFSWFDNDHDRKDKHVSFVNHFGSGTTQKILLLLFASQFLISSFQLFDTVLLVATVIILAMNIILFVLFYWKSYFKTDDRFRLLGDAVFFLPILYLLGK